MRSPARAVQRSPGLQKFGAILRPVLDEQLDKRPELLEPLRRMQRGEETGGFTAEQLADLRAVVAYALGASIGREDPGLATQIIAAATRVANDPDVHIADWAARGAPMGVTQEIPTVGIFPAAAPVEEPRRDPASLATHQEGWCNYTSVEDNLEVAQKLMQEAVAAKRCLEFDTMEQLLEGLGVADVTLNKLGLISKQREDGSWKHRLIWDLLRSKVNEAIRSSERVVLPRLQDAICDAVTLGSLCGEGDELEWMVLDVADAFHNVWLRPEEVKFCCTKVGNKFYVFLVLLFGAASSVPIWGRVAAWLARTTAALLHPGEAALQLYVDDPIVAARGTAAQRERAFAVVCIWASVIGLPLAWQKGVRGSSVTWIGAKLTCNAWKVTATIPEKKVTEILDETRSLLSGTIIYKKRLRSYCGKVSFAAGLVVVLRAFLACLWAPLTATDGADDAGGGHLHNAASRRTASRWSAVIHTRRVRHALVWLHAFFDRVGAGELARTFDFWPAPREAWTISVDASPWGFGAILQRGGRIEAWLADRIQNADLRRFRAVRGESKHMTLWEALAILVAVRAWVPADSRIVIEVRSDSMGALRMALKLASPTPELNKVAQELALDLADQLYDISILAHTPGVANVKPDALSRLFAPEPKAVPAALSGIRPTPCSERGAAFWKAALPPSSMA